MEEYIELVTTNIKLNAEDLLISIVIDITELENTIMNIEQSEKTYKLLLQTSTGRNSDSKSNDKKAYL